MQDWRRLSLKGATILSLLLLGIIALVLVFLTTEIYHQLVLENEERNLAAIIGIEAEAVRTKHFETVSKLADAIQKENGFKRAVAGGDTSTVQRILNDQFFQYYVTANVIALDHIMVFDTDLHLLTAANGKNAQTQGHMHAHCPLFIDVASKREGIERLHPFNALCVFSGRQLMLSIFSIGTFHPTGFLVLATDISKDYREIEDALNLPIQLLLSGEGDVYTSPGWESARQDNNYIIAEYTETDINNKPGITIHVARDFGKLGQNLTTLRLYALIFGSLITLVTIMFSMFFITRNALMPLHKLNSHLQKLQEDRSLLGKTVDIRANPEVTTLANSVNSLSRELRKAYDSLEKMAYTDPLTDLPNRSQLQKQLEFHASHALERNLPFTLFLMDLDRFKQVNDTIGHMAGDLLLRQVSERLQQVLRKTDLITRVDEWEIALAQDRDVARLGGDEFAAVLPGVGDINDAINIARKITREMSQPFNIEEYEFSIGISIGIVLSPMHGIDPSTLLRKADVAMYHAKNNQLGYYVYEQQADKHSIEILSLDKDIRNAITNDEFLLYYQPKIDLRSGRITGVEALIRWEKDGKMIFPDQFIGHAEKTGSIHNITEWVFKTALEKSRRWQAQGIELSVAINLSSKSLYSREMTELVMRQLDENPGKNGKLFLEITESSLMVDPTRSANLLRQIHSQNIGISIDDFGTGYSSLSKLKTLPVDEIKIDRSFVMDMLIDPNDAVIVESIINLAHNMNMVAVAEGVENQEILELLRQMGCDIIQGYHMGRPMPEKQLDEWLRASPWGLSPGR